MKKIKKSDINKINRFVKKYFKNPIVVTILLLTISVSTYYYNNHYIYSKKTAQTIVINEMEVRCVDGDTFKLGKDTIRMLAIDTPETVKPNTPVQPYGKKASDRTCDLLSTAKNIDLKVDPGNEEDKYNRKLAWVYVDEVLIQEILLKEGLAEIKYVQKKTIDKPIYKQLLEAEKYAKENNLGIWSNN